MKQAVDEHCNRRYRTLECVILFYLIPMIIVPFRKYLAYHIVPSLMIIAWICLFYLSRRRDFDRRILWQCRHLRSDMKNIFLLFFPAGCFFALLAYLFIKPHFLTFPKMRPGFWLLMMGFYPILAAYPQELIFRGFFFYRYRMVFPGKASLLVFNSLSFALAHLFYYNWVAPLLAFCGGLLFGYRYLKTGSLVTVSIEHGLWGDCLFTVGLGWYFYSGSI